MNRHISVDAFASGAAHTHIKKLVINFAGWRRCALVLASFALLSCTPYESDTTLGRILDEGVLKVGSIYGRTTYYYGASSAEGFEYELAQGFADYIGVKLEVYPYYDYRELVAQLDNQRVDLVAANIAMTDQRKARYKFGPAYQNLNFELVYKKGENRPRDISQLEGDLTIIANDLYREPLVDAISDELEVAWNETDERDIEELLEMVSNDELDYTISDSNILAVARRRFPNLGIGFSVTDTLQIAWLMNKQSDDSLRALLAPALSRRSASGLHELILWDRYDLVTTWGRELQRILIPWDAVAAGQARGTRIGRDQVSAGVIVSRQLHPLCRTANPSCIQSKAPSCPSPPPTKLAILAWSCSLVST